MYLSQQIANAISKTLVLVLAGGKGTRLGKLTRVRAKPAIEFGGQHRIIDFTLSNCVNSGFNQIAVVTQYNSQCLISHLMRHWGAVNDSPHGRLDILPAYSKDAQEGYMGTADACFKNLEYINAKSPEFVMILSGDQVYQMDYRQLIATHITQHSDVTLSCISAPVANTARQLGVVSVDSNNQIQCFSEKPAVPEQIPGKPGQCLTSMGIYLFNKDFLSDALTCDATSTGSTHDFGHDLLPRLIDKHRVIAHHFSDIAGNSKPYWRDVGTLDSYWQCHMDLLQHPERLRLDDPDWPLGGREHLSASSVISGNDTAACQLYKVQLANGCQLGAAQITHSVLSARCRVADTCTISHAVLLPDVSVDASVHLSRVIVERGCTIPANTTITDPEWARQQGLTVTPKGIILISQQDIATLTSGMQVSPAAHRHCATPHTVAPVTGVVSQYSI